MFSKGGVSELNGASATTRHSSAAAAILSSLAFVSITFCKTHPLDGWKQDLDSEQGDRE
jgi:hypothetical protein